MSFVATGYIMHNKMLNSLKAEGKVPAETTIKDIRLKEVIKLYGIEKIRSEVQEKNLDVLPDWLFCKDTGTGTSNNQVISDYFVEYQRGYKRQIWFFVIKDEMLAVELRVRVFQKGE